MMYHKIQSKNVRWPISMSVLVMALAAMVTLTPMAEASIDFYDGTFNLADWQSTPYYWGNGGSITLTQVAAGGNPGQFLEVDHYLQPAGAENSVVIGVHMRNGATYNPSIQGAITYIDYSLDFKNLQTTTQGMAFALAIKQNGKMYFTISEISGTLPGWQMEMGLGLQAASFGLWEPTPTNFYVDFSQHPNFSSSGSEINFGMFTGNSHTESDNPTSQIVGFDNWSVTVVPEPTTFAILALGGLLVKKRRKSA